MYYAHTPNSKGQWHDLSEHLKSVARLTESFARKYDAGELGYMAGLLHDIGKFNPEFQRYLEACFKESEKKLRGPGHASAGAVYGRRLWDGISVLLIGHHSGLPDFTKIKQQLKDRETEQTVIESFGLAEKHLGLNPDNPIPKPLPPYLSTETSLEFFLRMLFSALTDADFLDTEGHFEPHKTRFRGGYPSLASLWDRFENDQRRLTGRKKDTLNTLRHEIYKHCLRAAEMQPGVFKLTVPTGGGKTRSAMAFALRHAIKHCLDRVIFAIPYTSIIEQTAGIYKEIFGADNVIEHHSAMEPEADDDNPSLAELRSRLATENWDAPIVVTTTVQLFESLFANRSSRCRKLHNVARSVLILDEVQTLPSDLLEPILDVLKELTRNYGVTAVLCTATQPALEKGPYLDGFDDVTEIVPHASKYFSILKRVNYEIYDNETWDWERVAEEIRKTERSLTIVNTKKDAYALFEALSDPDAMHLTTALCPAHRRRVLDKAKQLLIHGQSCRLIATQVIEAGVDIDFPVVLRATGPLDRIVQAAGRCNREGKLKSGRVIIFNPSGGKVPQGDYRTGMDTAMTLLRQQDADLHKPALYNEYFRLLYQAVETDKHDIQPLRRALRFDSVAAKFRMIRTDTVPVVVTYNKEKVAPLLDDISSRGMITRQTMRRLQPYTVAFYKNNVASLNGEGLLKELVPGLFLWLGTYDPVLGVAAQKGMEPEDLIF